MDLNSDCFMITMISLLLPDAQILSPLVVFSSQKLSLNRLGGECVESCLFGDNDRAFESYNVYVVVHFGQGTLGQFCLCNCTVCDRKSLC